MEEERLIKKKLRARRAGNVRQLAEATNELADFYFQLGNLSNALQEYSAAIDAYEILGDKLNCAVAHRMIGEILTTSGDYEGALKHENLHLEGAQELKNEVEEQRAQASLGRTYFCMAESLPEHSDERIEALAKAEQAYARGILLCKELKGIPKQELMTMHARLLLNQGLVLEAQMEPDEAIDLIKSAIELCSENKLSEDLHRAYLALGALYDRHGNLELAFEHLDIAAKTEDVSMKANALLMKSEIFLKNGEWMNARKVLVSLYRMKSLSQSTREQLEQLLRIAVTLCRGEENLENSKHTDLNNSKLYEDLGDAAAAAHCNEKALEYYNRMLLCAERDGSIERISAALVSLAQTLKDADRYEEALPFARRELDLCIDPSEQCRSALFLADLLECNNSKSSEIIDVFKLALQKAEISKNPSLEVTVLKEYHHYLNKEKDSQGAEEIEARLNLLLEQMPEVESEPENLESLNIGADIHLDDLTDLDDTEEERRRSKRKRVRNKSDKKTERGESLLHVACIKGNIAEVQRLLDAGHSTDVRDYCGWTPLHEAANNGFLEIAELLINAGANVNDPGGALCDGITPLHDAATCGHTSILNLLIERGADIYALTKGGDSVLDSLEAWHERVEDISAMDELEYNCIRNKLSKMGIPRRKGRGEKITSPNRNRSNLDEEDGEITKISAGEDYKRTIAVLRNRGAQLLPSKKSSSSRKDPAPLLDSEEILADEWLVNDTVTNVNKKRSSFNNPLSTAKRKSGDFEAVGERESKRQRTRSDNEIMETINIYDDQGQNSDSNSGESWDIIAEPAKSKTRKRQSSLLSCGFLQSSVSRTPSPDFVVSQKSAVDTNPKNISLQVWVEEKLFNLQLAVLEEQKISAENIVREVQKKFEEDTGCIPHFELVGANGDTISPQDNIDASLSGANQLILNTKLKKMDVPPLSDRYEKICSTSEIDVEEGIVKCLKTCENTLIFKLRDGEIIDCNIIPLLKSLEYQIRLQVLCLSGGIFNNVGPTLNRCLSNLVSLQELSLHSCDIDASCLMEIKKLPLQIKSLDLSYNPLGKDSENQLHRLLSPLKNLQTLNIAYCELYNFRQGTTNPSLTNLNISWNSLTQDGFKSVLQPHILSLKASGLSNEAKPIALASELISYPKFSLSTLESLELSSCDLSDSDLSKILLQTANLNRLIVNGNRRLTKLSAIQVLLHKPTISYIDISGCDEINEPPDISSNISNPKICTLLISMALDVQKSWLNLWHGEATIQNLPFHVVIFKPD